MNFDETLAFVAADMIWEYAKEEGKVQPVAHRAKEFPYTVYEGSQGLIEHRHFWTPNYDSLMIRQGKHMQANCPEIVESLDGRCVCPDWMDCYCQPE